MVNASDNRRRIIEAWGNERVRRCARAMLLSLAIVATAGCPRRPPPPPQAPVAVHVATVTQQPMPVEVHAIGTVEAYSTVEVKAQVTAQVLDAPFRAGHDVKKGDVLFTLDARPFEAALKQAEANQARDQYSMKNAELEALRSEDLLANGFASQEDYDQRRTTADTLRAAVAADVAACDLAKLQIGYCTIPSPLDARAGSVLVKPGNQIKANDATMVVLNQITPVYVDFAVPEGELQAIRRRMAEGELRVRAAIPDDTGPPEDGTLTFVDNAVDTTTGRIMLKGTFSNEARRLWPGQFVSVVLVLATQPDALVVPSQAVQVNQTGTFAFVVKPDKTVESRPVVVDREVEGQTVIKEGLSAQEVVVTDGQLQLVPGSKVEVKAESPSGKAQGA